MERIEGRTAFITGGASGIGLAIAEALLAEGAKVVLADIDETRAQAEAQRLGDKAMAIGLDVSDRASWADAKAAAQARFGPVEILVNNAGIGYDGSDLADMDPAGFDRMMRINTTGVFNGISAFAADMRGRGEGHIINTASLAGLLPLKKTGAYTAAKFAVVGLSEVLRAELRSAGVGVTVLCPGPIATRLGETTRASGSSRVEISAASEGDWMDPAIVGKMVVDGIRRSAFYVHTHQMYRAPIQARMDKVMATFDDIP